jgi:hypothetical protein
MRCSQKPSDSDMTAHIAVGNRAATARTASRVEISPLWAERGLAVHQSHARNGWTITHLASGYAIFQGIRTHRDAITVANRLLDAGDWTRSRTQVTSDRRLRDRAAQVRDEARLLGLLS